VTELDSKTCLLGVSHELREQQARAISAVASPWLLPEWTGRRTFDVTGPTAERVEESYDWVARTTSLRRMGKQVHGGQSPIGTRVDEQSAGRCTSGIVARDDAPRGERHTISRRRSNVLVYMFNEAPRVAPSRQSHRTAASDRHCRYLTAYMRFVNISEIRFHMSTHKRQHHPLSPPSPPPPHPTHHPPSPSSSPSPSHPH